MIKDQLIVILQITAICNAIILGWRVKVEGNKIILRKKLNEMTSLDNDIPILIKCLLNL
jgi:hypothetical protein